MCVCVCVCVCTCMCVHVRACVCVCMQINLLLGSLSSSCHLPLVNQKGKASTAHTLQEVHSFMSFVSIPAKTHGYVWLWSLRMCVVSF